MKFIYHIWNIKKVLLLNIFLILYCSQVFAQSFCTGNLGDNIFTDGDFGSGSANIVSQDQGIAPGYTYTFNPPPVDGEYIISNNTGNWANLYDSWLRISDNSSDPNGYMMVVNASFDVGLFYEQQVANLCENTEYEFSADVINMIRRNVGGHIAPNVSFLINGVEIISTGDIPQDERWHNFGFTITTAPGQTSFTLSLRNNAPGGIGNDLAIDNISFRACGPQIEVASLGADTICGLENAIANLEATVIGSQFSSPTYQWQESTDGQNWQNIAGATNNNITITDLTAGNNFFRFLLANSVANISSSLCRINSDMKRIYVSPTNSNFSDTICAGLSITFGGNSLSSSGIYKDTLTNLAGCDSVVTLNLEVLPDPNITANILLNQRNCPEQELSSITILEVENGTAPYSYQLGSTILTGQDSVFTDLVTGNYNLLITDQLGCTYEGQVEVDTFSLFSVTLDADTIDVVLGNDVTITASANSNVSFYTWSPFSPCRNDCEVFSFTPTDSRFVSLVATSDLGCQATDSAFVRVNKLRLIQFPTAFSPNKDGNNDLFSAVVSEPNVIAIQNLVVYDRWGNSIFTDRNFQASDPLSGWDGKKDGQDLPQGIYPYKAEVLFLDNEVIIYEGAILLIR